MADALSELMAMAVKPKPKAVKEPKSFDQKFKEAVAKQRQKLADRGEPANTDWFQQADGKYHVRLGRKKIGFTKPDGKDQFYFEAADADGVNRIFDLAERLLVENEDFRNKVREQYGSPVEKETVEPPQKRGGRRKKAA